MIESDIAEFVSYCISAFAFGLSLSASLRFFVKLARLSL